VALLLAVRHQFILEGLEALHMFNYSLPDDWPQQEKTQVAPAFLMCLWSFGVTHRSKDGYAVRAF